MLNLHSLPIVTEWVPCVRRMQSLAADPGLPLCNLQFLLNWVHMTILNDGFSVVCISLHLIMFFLLDIFLPFFTSGSSTHLSNNSWKYLGSLFWFWKSIIFTSLMRLLCLLLSIQTFLTSLPPYRLEFYFFSFNLDHGF